MLVLMIAGLALNTGLQLWSVVTSPASRVDLDGTTANASWQFVDDFPPELADELHFILNDSGAWPEASLDRNEAMSQPSTTQVYNINALGGQTEQLVAVGSVSLAGRLARFDHAGNVVAFGVNTPLTFPELVADVKLNCGDVIRDEVETTVSFTSKNGTRWKCLLIEGDSEDSFVICEKIENIPGPHKNE